MTVLVLGLAALALLALNAFFVLAEFAIVRVRPSRVAELVAAGDARARTLGLIQAHLDEHLGVCQVGITLASVALGMVCDGVAGLITGGAPSPLRAAAAIGVSYVVISGSHIVLGEQVPKSVAIRVADRAALWVTAPLRLFRLIFYPGLFLLNRVASRAVRLLGFPPNTGEELHSEGELRIILENYQERGMLSFRRLLYLENVFDLGALKVRDAMRPRSQVRSFDARAPWADNLRIARAARFTRYPLVDVDRDRPLGFVHLKDVLLRGGDREPGLRELVRPLLETAETTPLESLLSEMQRRRIHAALVVNAARQWTGFVTLEDIVEELIGTIRDEFEDEEAVRLGDALTRDRIHLGVEADSPVAAVDAALARMKTAELPLSPATILAAVAERERTGATYLGHGVGLPHARVPGLGRPFLMIIRSERGIPCRGTPERAHLLFVLLTPAGQPRIHQRLQSLVATLLHESEFVTERLHSASSPDEVLEAIRTGEQASLD